MKFKSLLWASLAAVTLLFGCKEKEDFGEPALKVTPATLDFSSESDSKTATITATRDWRIENAEEYDWVDLGPAKGAASLEPQTITVTVTENTGRDRTAELKVTIGLISKTLTVKQLGQGGSSEPVYFNDFDKEKAEKTYGSGSSYPYLDQFDGWMNQTGTGAASVEYDYSGMSVRSNSNSDGSYSDYEGSGINNLFYGKSAHFAVKNIALNGSRNFVLTFGTEKYSQDNGSLFTPSEYHVYVSNDAQKWVEIEYEFAGTAEGRWNVASAAFTVPEGTENLSLYFGTDVASSYRMDDLKLDITGSEGTLIDFSKGVDLGTGGGDTPGPSDITDITVADFIAAPVDANKYYRLTGTVVGPIQTQYGNFDIKDETGQVYVYGTDNWADYKDTFAAGGTVVFVGTRGEYNGKIEVLNGYIENFTPGEGGGDEPGEVTDATVAEFIAAPVDANKLYRVTGTVVGTINTQYGNFYIEDETGKVQVYGTTNFADFKDEFALGGTVVYVGARSEYNGTPQFKDGKIESFTPGEGGGDEPGFEIPENVIYYNNFDKTVVTSNTTLTDAIDVYKNETGSGISAVTYSYTEKAVSARVSSPSDGSKSSAATNYKGSGNNNIFFGYTSSTDESAYFIVSNIAVTGQNFTLSFGTVHGNGVFDPANFEVYVSDNSENWVKLDYSFPNALASKTWDYASTVFSIPDGINALSFKFLSKVKSIHRIDDLMLAPSEAAGTLIEFTGSVQTPLQFELEQTTLEAEAADQAARFNVIADDQVEWTLSSEPAVTLTVDGGGQIGTGSKGVTINMPENTSSDPKVFNIKVTTTNENVENKELTLVFTQKGAEGPKTFQWRADSPTEVKVGAAEAGAAHFYIESTVDWTAQVTLDGVLTDAGVTIEHFDVGGGHIAINYPTNETEVAKVWTITVTTEADVTNKTLTATLTQEGKAVQGGSAIELTFPDGNQQSIGSYTDSWEAVMNGYTWTIENFNNNKNGWAYIKCGRKDNPSVAAISTKTPIPSHISSVVVTIDNILDASKIKDAYLLVASDEAFTDVKETITITPVEGENTYAIGNSIENGYYKLVYDCDSHSKNGIIQISKVVYNVGVSTGGGGEVPQGKQYKKITDVSELTKGSTVIIVCDKASKAAGAFDAASKTRAAEDVTISNGVVTNAGNALEFQVLNATAKVGAFSFKASDGYLGFSMNDGMSVSDEMSGFNIAFDVTISTDGVATLKGVWPNNIVYYYSESGTFNGLSGKTGDDVSIYKLVE